MFAKFDKNKFKKIVKRCGFTQKDIAETLTSNYLIETKLDTVKTWTRTEDRSVPSTDRLNALADICSCSIQDFFSDADVKREQITLQEISNQPNKYSKSLLSTLSTDIRDLMNYYQMLDAEDRKKYLEEIKQKAMSKLHES